MFWAHATPLRRERDVLGDGKEVLVYIDEPVETASAISPPASPTASPARPGTQNFGDNPTPIRRNSYRLTTSEKGRNDESKPEPRRGRDGTDYLAIPDLRPDDDGTVTEAETTPRSDFGRVPSNGSACGSAGSISRGHATDDSEASEDDESLGKQEEEFERAVIKVSLADGCIILEFPEKEEERRAEPLLEEPPGDGDVGDDEASDNESESAGVSIISSSAFLDAEDEAWESDDNSLKSEPCQFELQSTNIHWAEDDRQREHDKIRLAVLGAAADAYKKINEEVPDLILAQINESRETVRLGSCGKNLVDLGSGLGKKDKYSEKSSKERQSNKTKDVQQSKKQILSTKIGASIAPEKSGSAQKRDKKRDEDKHGPTAGKPRLRTKKLKLRSEDEIHALPCQCALTLVGMRGCSHLTPPSKSPQGAGANQLAESFITRSLFGSGGGGGSMTTAGIVPKTPDRRPSLPVPHTAPARPPARSGSFLSLIGGGATPYGHKDDSMVRTSSAKAADVVLPSRARHVVPSVATPEFLSGSSSAGDGSLKLGGPPDLGTLKRSRSGSAESIFPQLQPGNTGSMARDQRCEASSFTSMGYHEIVLLRSGSAKEAEHTFDSWDALTIRCSDHDEMDRLILNLKQVKKSTVVPFSPNPKAKLKKRQEKERSALKQRRGSKTNRNRKRRSSELACGSKSKTMNAIDASGLLTHEPHSQDSPAHLARNSKKGRLEESEQWNKCDHCEICRVNFTLLVRRHHCRKCDKSVCGSCSSVVLVSGRGKRLCCGCSPKVEDANKVIKESKKWSKEDHCEMCLCLFTLLTRRHHCRKCDKSVCGNCSSVLLVRGGEEKRYCNRCSTEILRKQSRELHRRFAGYQRRMTSALLPGKVHNDCRRLGVGVLGKLPHWRNYISIDQNHRPAVGRITVELLEALAVPAIDGKADPYVRATITGYDRDMRWNLKEWNRTFSLCSSYCMGTLSPIWRGSGKKGGELLTLPIISTAGAVLRLEVLHYDILTNRRGRDAVLGVVEIPLSDITNANLRRAATSQVRESEGRKKLSWDGYCDRWYQLQRASDLSAQTSTMAKPISDPHSSGVSADSRGTEGHPRSGRASSKKNGLQSLEELGQRFHGWCRVPVEWVGSALNIDIPHRRPDALSALRSRSAIHVRLKLNCNEVGDFLSHVWFPPVECYPPVPPYDPNILWRNILRVGKQVKPYQKICKFVEDAIKWRHPPKTCIQSYFVFAFHLGVFPRILYFLHGYLFLFLMFQLQKTARANLRSAAEGHQSADEIQRVDSFSSSSVQIDTMSSESDYDEGKGKAPRAKSVVISSPSLEDLSPQTKKKRDSGRNVKQTGENSKENETARLNKAVHWIAKRLGDNRGLEILQFKLGMLGRDLTNLNSLWDGSSAVKICASMNIIFISFVLHCYVRWRLLWIGGTAVCFFGSSPFSVRRARNMVGFWRGMAKVMRRRNLHDVESKEQAKNK